MSSEAAAVLYSLLTILAIWVLWISLFRDYRSDVLRHSLRMLYDECFDHAGSGAVLYSDPAYRLLQKLISKAASNADRITFTRVLAAALLLRTGPEKPGITKNDGSETGLDSIRARMADLILSHALGIFSSKCKRRTKLAELAIASAAGDLPDLRD